MERFAEEYAFREKMNEALAASSGSKFSAWDPMNSEFLLALRFQEMLENEFSSASKSEWQDAEEDFHEPTSFTEDLNGQNNGFEQQEWSDIEEFGSYEEEEEEEDWRDAEEEEEYSDLSCCNFPDCRDSSDIPGSIARGSCLESYYKMVFKGMSEIRSGELGLSSSGIGVVIQSPDGDNLMQVQKKFDFYVDKMVAEHLALMDGVLAALELRVPRVQAFTDSDLVYDQIGKTKVFLRAGQIAELDVRRTELLGNSTKNIQCKVRSYIARKEFLALCNAAIDLQALWRGNLTCKFYNNMRREAVVVRIQKHVCRYKAQKAQKAQKHVQCGYKGTCADRNLRKWAIEYEEPVAEAFPLIMKTLLLRVSSC